MSGGKQPAQTTQETAPWAAQQPFLTKGFDAAGNALDSLPATTYQGPAIAPVTDQQKSSAQGLYDVGTALQTSGFGQNFLNMANATANGDYLDPSKNTALMNAVDTSNNAVSKWLTDTALPGVRDSSLASGYYGGGRQGVAQAQVIGQARDAAQANANNLILGDYNTERANQLNVGTQLGQAAQLLSAPTTIQNSAATTSQGYDQAALDKILGDQSYLFSSPYLGLQDYMNLVSGNYGGTGTSTSTPATGSTASSALKGALGGAATGAAVGSVVPGIGTGIGALVGGGAGILGGLLG